MQEAVEMLAKQLEEYKKSLTEEEIEQLMADTKHLKQYQDEPSEKEDLEKIPMLTRADLKKKHHHSKMRKNNAMVRCC